MKANDAFLRATTIGSLPRPFLATLHEGTDFLACGCSHCDTETVTVTRRIFSAIARRSL